MRPKKTAVYDADDQTIMAYFDAALELAEQQRSAGRENTAHNVEMADEGVHPGTLATCRRLALMPEGKRGIALALLHRYLQVLASKLDDPTMPKAEAAEKPVPFGRRARGVAAA